MQKNTKIIVAGIIFLFSIMGIVIGNHTSFKDDLEDLKPVARENNVSLLVLTQTNEKTFDLVGEKITANSNLGFKISTSLPIHIALFVSVNNNSPTTLLKSARIRENIIRIQV